MSRPTLLISAAILSLAAVSFADKKNQNKLPALVVKAQTVYVVMYPDTGVSVTNPGDNQHALLQVEDAIAKWGKYQLVLEPQEADLVIAIRKGRQPGPVINTGNRDPYPVGIESGEDSTRVRISHGTQPPVTQQSPMPPEQHPTVGTQVGNRDDLFEVYGGRVRYPLDGSVLWRYSGKNALDAPNVKAVKEFRKAVEESEKKKP